MQYIQDNDLDELKKLKVAQKDINFLMEFPENDLDKRLTPLVLASALGRQDAVRMMLNNPSADIDLASEETGYTPLAAACATGNYDVVRTLMDFDPEVNTPNRYNQTPFILAFTRLNEELNVFENRKIAFKLADLLLANGADINWIVDKAKGYTLLMQLCATKLEMSDHERDTNFEAVKFLLERGGSKDIKSLKNKTCLELVEKNPNKDMLLTILKTTSSPMPKPRKMRQPSISVDKKKLQTELDKERHSALLPKKK